MPSFDAGLQRFVLEVIVLLFLGAMTFYSLWQFIQSSQEPIRFDANWGGFGSGLGGWSISRTLSLMLATLLFGLLFAASGAYSLRQDGKEGKEAEKVKATDCGGGAGVRVDVVNQADGRQSSATADGQGAGGNGAGGSGQGKGGSGQVGVQAKQQRQSISERVRPQPHAPPTANQDPVNRARRVRRKTRKSKRPA